MASGCLYGLAAFGRPGNGTPELVLRQNGLLAGSGLQAPSRRSRRGPIIRFAHSGKMGDGRPIEPHEVRYAFMKRSWGIAEKDQEVGIAHRRSLLADRGAEKYDC